jgi:hypothetical protein
VESRRIDDTTTRQPSRPNCVLVKKNSSVREKRLSEHKVNFLTDATFVNGQRGIALHQKILSSQLTYALRPNKDGSKLKRAALGWPGAPGTLPELFRPPPSGRDEFGSDMV